MLEAIENSAYATWVRESPSIFAYTTVLSLHAIGLAIIVGINYLIALRLLGFVSAIPLQPLRKLFPWMYLGFTINLFSGASLLAANLTNDLGNWLFICKLVFIALAMIIERRTRMPEPLPLVAALVLTIAAVWALVGILVPPVVQQTHPPAVGVGQAWRGAMAPGPVRGVRDPERSARTCAGIAGDAPVDELEAVALAPAEQTLAGADPERASGVFAHAEDRGIIERLSLDHYPAAVAQSIEPSLADGPDVAGAVCD